MSKRINDEERKDKDPKIPKTEEAQFAGYTKIDFRGLCNFRIPPKWRYLIIDCEVFRYDGNIYDGHLAIPSIAMEWVNKETLKPEQWKFHSELCNSDPSLFECRKNENETDSNDQLQK